MIKIRAVIEHITYQNSENGYSILKGKVKDHNDLVTLVGTMLEVPVGSVLLCEGDWKIDRKYGKQFIVQSFEESLIVMIIFPPNGLLVCHCGSRIIRAAQECCSAWGKQVFRIGVVTMYREVLFPVVEERDQSACQALHCTVRRGNSPFPT